MKIEFKKNLMDHHQAVIRQIEISEDDAGDIEESDSMYESGFSDPDYADISDVHVLASDINCIGQLAKSKDLTFIELPSKEQVYTTSMAHKIVQGEFKQAFEAVTNFLKGISNYKNDYQKMEKQGHKTSVKVTRDSYGLADCLSETNSLVSASLSTLSEDIKPNQLTNDLRAIQERCKSSRLLNRDSSRLKTGTKPEKLKPLTKLLKKALKLKGTYLCTK